MWARQRNVYLLIPASSLPPLPRRLYDNELPSSANQLRRWLHELCTEAAAVRRSAAVAPVFVCSPPAAGARRVLLSTMRLFFYSSTAGAPVGAAEDSPVGVLMAGLA